MIANSDVTDLVAQDDVDNFGCGVIPCLRKLGAHWRGCIEPASSKVLGTKAILASTSPLVFSTMSQSPLCAVGIAVTRSRGLFK